MHSFLTQLISNLKQYLNSDFRYSWAEYIICNKNHQTNHLVSIPSIIKDLGYILARPV